MREIALHILDIVENSTAAGATEVLISVIEHVDDDRLIISVRDDGNGIEAGIQTSITDPFTTSRTSRKVGLGIPLFKAAAEACNGNFVIESKPGLGTTVQAEFQLSHIDRMPTGDLSGTYLNLLIAYPEIHWHFYHEVIYKGHPEIFDFDDEPIKDVLSGIPVSEPEVISYLKSLLENGMCHLPVHSLELMRK